MQDATRAVVLSSHSCKCWRRIAGHSPPGKISSLSSRRTKLPVLVEEVGRHDFSRPVGIRRRLNVDDSPVGQLRYLKRIAEIGPLSKREAAIEDQIPLWVERVRDRKSTR